MSTPSITKPQANLIAALLGAVLAMLAFVAFWPASNAVEAEPANTAAATDQREAVVFNAAQHQFALRQMRGLLVTIRSLDAAAIADDPAAMIALAREQGPRANPDQPTGFQQALPEGFRAMSKSMRQSFAGMAADLQAGNRAGYDAKRLQALDTCIACHESYRFDEQ